MIKVSTMSVESVQVSKNSTVTALSSLVLAPTAFTGIAPTALTGQQAAVESVVELAADAAASRVTLTIVVTHLGKYPFLM